MSLFIAAKIEVLENMEIKIGAECKEKEASSILRRILGVNILDKFGENR